MFEKNSCSTWKARSASLETVFFAKTSNPLSLFARRNNKIDRTADELDEISILFVASRFTVSREFIVRPLCCRVCKQRGINYTVASTDKVCYVNFVVAKFMNRQYRELLENHWKSLKIIDKRARTGRRLDCFFSKLSHL